jgi:hypothetical protein
MSVSGISSSSFAQYGGPAIAPSQQRQQEDLIGRELEQDLKNGDLDGAKQAYNQLAAFGPNNSGPFSGAQMTAQFQLLGQDLQAGNLSGAQSVNDNITHTLLNEDAQTMIQDSEDGNKQGLQAAVATLKGDYWAVYGQQITNGQLKQAFGQGTGTTPINVEA